MNRHSPPGPGAPQPDPAATAGRPQGRPRANARLALVGGPTPDPAAPPRHPAVPLSTDRARLVAHARRMAAMNRYVAADPRASEFAPLIVAFSQALDLGVSQVKRGPRRLARMLLWAGELTAAGGATLAARVASDAPRYSPPRLARCPGTGPRGGRCRRSSGRFTQVLTDPDTGAWAHGYVCADHAGSVPEYDPDRHPSPPPNDGGLLARVFPELGWAPVYRWAYPRWEDVLGGPDTAPPSRLSLVRGDGSDE